ncbi:MAG: hypothetical protein ACRCTK_04170, partial [Alphaproteobacteria bacterium]
MQSITLSLLPSFVFGSPVEPLPSIINPESFKNATAILTRVADGDWNITGDEQPEDVRLVVIKNPSQKQTEPPSPESTPNRLLQLLRRFPKMETCDVQDFLLDEMKPLFHDLASYKDLQTLRIAGQTLEQPDVETLFKLPLKALKFANSTLSAENAAPLPKTLEIFSYKVIPWLESETPYDPMDATFFEQANALKKIKFDYIDAWQKFWAKPPNLKNSLIEEIYLYQPSVWERPTPISDLTNADLLRVLLNPELAKPRINASHLGSFPAALNPKILSKYFKRLKIFSFHEYGPDSQNSFTYSKRVSYIKDKNLWSFSKWQDPNLAEATCLQQWEIKLKEIQKSFPGAQFHFSDMGSNIMAKFQEMQQQDVWKDEITFNSKSSDEAEETYID